MRHSLSALNNCLAVLFLLLAMPNAFADQAVDLPDWFRFSLSQHTVLSDIYQNSIADSVFVRMTGKGFLPPVQHLTREAGTDIESDSTKISQEILTNLGVDQSARSTLQMKAGKFAAGPQGTLNGYFLEYNSSAQDGSDTVVTCMVFVKDGDKTHAAYVQASRSSLATCARDLVALAHTVYLYK